ncbi:hypothetical protein KRP22_001951 [Phytophthora ramorum]|nr:hypothetical protein KRP22_1235 [Phytophthora ramorum]
MADPLISPFAELCGALRGLQTQVEQLARVHEAVDDFNSAFGAFQGAMALHASCLTYPRTAPPTRRNSLPRGKQTPAGTVIAPPSGSQTSPIEIGVQMMHDASSAPKNKAPSKAKGNGKANGEKKAVAVGTKRRGKEPQNNSRKRRKPLKATQPAWTWERHIREKIPRKYQSPAELKKLENIVLYLKNRHCAISITDLVKHSGLPVIRCKEILQTLMKLDIVQREREKSGFVYSFGSSN